MNMDLITVISAAVVANTLGLAVLAFLAKAVITHWLTKDVASFKSQLEQQSAVAIANYESKLEQERIRLQISYGGIFEQQAEVILEIYKKLDRFHKNMSWAVDLSSDKARAGFLDSLMELTSYLDRNRILLPQSLDKQLTGFVDQIFRAVDSHTRAENNLSRPSISHERMERMFNQQDKARAILDQAPRLKNDLMVEFRSVLGVLDNDRV